MLVILTGVVAHGPEGELRLCRAVDRIVHHATILEMNGPSIRATKVLKGSSSGDFNLDKTNKSEKEET